MDGRTGTGDLLEKNRDQTKASMPTLARATVEQEESGKW